jgi:hypothetical protein
MKPVNQMVFPVLGYTDKIQEAAGQVFASRPWLTFTRSQLTEDVIRQLPWLKGTLSDGQKTVLSFVISTSIRLFIQRGLIKKVKGPTSVEPEWQSTQGINVEVYKNLTGSDCVADNLSKLGNRALSAKRMYTLNKA